MTALATVLDVEAVLQREIAADDIPRVTRLIEMASGVVRREAGGQTITAVAGDVTTLAGTYETELWLPQRPVTAVTSITVDGIATVADTYRWTRHGRLYRTSYDREIPDWRSWGAWGTPDAAVVVTYDHGYAEPPDDLALVVAEMVATRISNPESLRSESVEDYSVGHTQPATGEPLSFGMTDAHRETIARYAMPITSVPITTDSSFAG